MDVNFNVIISNSCTEKLFFSKVIQIKVPYFYTEKPQRLLWMIIIIMIKLNIMVVGFIYKVHYSKLPRQKLLKEFKH